MNSRLLYESLASRISSEGFVDASTLLPNNTDGLLVIGCLQKKTLNIHRAICVVAIDDSISEPEASIVAFRERLHKSLKARFMRGLGLGLVIISAKPIRESLLEHIVDYAATRTTIIQWVVNVPKDSSPPRAAHTWMQVSISHILDYVFEALRVPESERKIIVVQPKGQWRTLFRFVGYNPR